MLPDSFVIVLYEEEAKTLDFVLMRDRGAELPRQLAAQNAGGGGAVLQRGSVVVEIDELRK